MSLSTCPQGHLKLNHLCPDCKNIKKQWTLYLKFEGFDDIETKTYDNHETKRLKVLNSFKSAEAVEAKINYYSWAREKVHTGSFKDDRDRMIWEYHVEGLSRRQISPRVGLEQSWITRRIHKIESYLKTGLSNGLQLGANCVGSLSYSMGAT